MWISKVSGNYTKKISYSCA